MTQREVRVGVFLTRFEPGGTERQMIELIRRLASRFVVHVACFDRAGAWLPRAAERAASVVEFPIRGFARAGTAAQLLSFARWCRRRRLMVVQTCDLYTNIFGLPGAALAGVPVRIGSRRELAPDKTRAQLLLQRQAYRCATKVVANSPSARRILEAEGLATGSIAVIPNGVDHHAFAARTPRPGGLREILTVANLRPEKNHDVLLRAAAELAREYPDLRLRFAGAGPQRAALESLAASLGLSGRVELLGHRDDVPALLAQADMFVLPSRSEAFPNGAIEAMAAGLPVVASATGGLSDLIAHERTGLLVPPGAAGALAAAMRRLIEEPALAASLGERARREMQERYSFERMADAFEALYLSGLPAGVDVPTHRPEAAGI